MLRRKTAVKLLKRKKHFTITRRMKQSQLKLNLSRAFSFQNIALSVSHFVIASTENREQTFSDSLKTEKNGSTAAISRLRSAASFVVKSQILREWSRSRSSAFSIPHFLVKRAKPPARQRACYPSLDALPRITSFSLSPRARDFAAVFIVVSRSDRQKHQCGWSIQISSSNSYLKFLLPSTS